MVDAKNRVVLSAVFGPIFVIAIVFVTAGTFDYWQGILYTALTLTMIAVSNLSMRKNKELINERLKPGAGTKSWDRIYLRLSTLFFFVAHANAAPIYALSVIQRSKELLQSNLTGTNVLLSGEFIVLQKEQNATTQENEQTITVPGYTQTIRLPRSRRYAAVQIPEQE